MKNKIEDLRNHLFVTIEALLDHDNPLDLERAKTIAEVGQVIVNSAKAEVDFLKTVAGTGSGFFPESPRTEIEPPKGLIQQITISEPEISEFDKALSEKEEKTKKLTNGVLKPIYTEYQG